MKASYKTILLLTTGLMSLSACTSAPGPQETRMDIPSVWSRLIGGEDNLNNPIQMSEDAQVDQTWWKNFEDPTLDALVQEALENNKTLKIAAARVAESRAGRLSAQSSLLPQINATTSSQRGNQGLSSFDKTLTQSDISVQASWEIDIFGGNQAKAAEADAILQSREASQNAVRVSLLAELARNYFDMRNLERQIELTNHNLELQRKTFSIVQVQVKEQAASDLDLQRAGAQVSTTEAELPNLKTAYAGAVNRINVLLGVMPGTKDSQLAEARALKPLKHTILIAAPASIIAERPDIKVAERNFAASISAKQAATADLFPKISLTSFFGAQTVSPDSFTPWGLGINLIQPLLNFGRIQSQIDAKDAQKQQAFLSYQQTVLEAVENVENSVSAYMNETVRNSSLRDAMDKNRKAESLSQEQYKNGYIGLLDLLIAQQNVLAAESAYTESEIKLRNDLVAVYTAAGGGWK